jgi:hypothetical protein
MHPLRSFTDCNCGFFQLRSLLSFRSKTVLDETLDEDEVLDEVLDETDEVLDEVLDETIVYVNRLFLYHRQYLSHSLTQVINV